MHLTSFLFLHKIIGKAGQKRMELVKMLEDMGNA
jgi:hypothetical protein